MMFIAIRITSVVRFWWGRETDGTTPGANNKKAHRPGGGVERRHGFGLWWRHGDRKLIFFDSFLWLCHSFVRVPYDPPPGQQVFIFIVSTWQSYSTIMFILCNHQLGHFVFFNYVDCVEMNSLNSSSVIEDGPCVYYLLVALRWSNRSAECNRARALNNNSNRIKHKIPSTTTLFIAGLVFSLFSYFLFYIRHRFLLYFVCRLLSRRKSFGWWLV